MSGIVVVSHSRQLAEAAVALVAGLMPSLDVNVQVAAGTPDGGLGTDPTAVMAGIEAADDELAERTVVSPASLVEGLLAAYAAAGTGCPFDQVCERAANAAADKRCQVEG